MCRRLLAMLMAVVLATTGIDMTAFAAEQKENVLEESKVESGIGTPEVTGSNSVGTILADALSSEQTEQAEDNGNCIMSVEMTETTAAVRYVAMEPATLVVGVYDNAGERLLATGTKEVDIEVRETTVTIDIDEMPQYYYLKAFLIESDTLKPLCGVYDNPNYTEEMQAFFAKTTDDFEQERVYNLDDDKTNNFLVYGEEVARVEASETVNALVSADEENYIYIFENIDENISGLSKGDIFTYGEENPLVIKVDSITIDGSKATINGAAAEMEEVFEFVKIDTSCDIVLPEEETETQTQSDYGATSYGMSGYAGGEYNAQGWGIEIDESLKVTKDVISKDFFKKKLPGGAELEGKFELTPGVEIKIYHDDYTYVEMKLSAEVKVSISLSKEWTGEIPITEVPLAAAGVILVTLPVYFVIEVEGSVTFSGTLSAEMGFSYHSEKGVKWIKLTPVFKLEVEVEVSVFAGIRVAMQASVLKIISIEYNVDVGAELTATYTKELFSSAKPEDVKHACENCIDGDVNAKLKMGWIFRVFGEEEDSDDLAEVSIKVADFYYSFDKKEFGFAECPYKSCKITIKVLDDKGEIIPEAVINRKYLTDNNGCISFYLENGIHKLILTNTGYDKLTRKIKVEGAPLYIVWDIGKSTFRDDDYYNGEIVFETVDWKDIELAYFSCGAIAENDAFYMWGSNVAGNLGDGTNETRNEPVKVLENVAVADLGRDYSGAITKENILYTWGSNSYNKLGDDRFLNGMDPQKVMGNVVDVSLGTDHSGAIMEDGSLYMWGKNDCGQLGDGTTTNQNQPVKVMNNVIDVCLGYKHSGAITEDGSLYMWGYNLYGQLGDATTINCSQPIKIMSNVVAVSLGEEHSGAITEDGSLYMWGYNNCGQLGDGTTTSQTEPIKVMENVIAVSLGDYFSGAITEDGSLYMWGNNNWGQLGDCTTINRIKPIKVLDNVVDISFGESFSGAITKDGNLYMWGYNGNGQLGDGTTIDYITQPKLIKKRVQMRFVNSSGEIMMFSLGNETNQNDANFVGTNEWSTASTTDGLDSTTDGSDGTTDGNDTTTTMPTPSTVTFTDKMPGETYNFYVMKTRTGSDDATSDNILYLDQVVANTEGKVSITYIPREEYEGAKIFLSGRMGKYDFMQATVVANDMLYTGGELFADVTVTYDGKELTEGIDYDLCGSYSATEPGEYTVTAVGRGEYKGSVSATYHIRRYSLDVFGVIFDSNGGTAVETQEVEKGQSATEPEPPSRENHVFVGWYLNGELYDFATPVEGNMTLVAEWDEFNKLTKPLADIPNGSRVNAGKELTLTSQENAAIYYTTDGTLPTIESSLYSEPISITEDMTIRAFAVKEGYYDSDVAVYDYTVVTNGDAFDTVAPEDIPDEGIPTGIWVGKIADQNYTGKAIKPEVRVYDGTKRLVAGRDYTVSYKNNVKAQTDLTAKKVPTVVIKGKGNYTKTLQVPFKILPKNLLDEDIVTDEIFVAYNGKVQKKTPTLYWGTKKLSKKDVVIEYTDSAKGAYQDYGTYQIKVTGQGNYTGEKYVNLSVTDKKFLSSVKVAKVSNQPYEEEKPATPTLTVSYKGTTLTEGTDYEVSFINNKEIGTATAILTGKGDYVGTKRVNFKITGTSIKKVSISPLENAVYNGAPITQLITLIYNNETLIEDKHYSVTYQNNTNVGTATVTITGKGAFTGTVKKKFKIAAYDLKTDTENVVNDVSQNFEVLYEKGGSKPSVDVVYKGQSLVAGKDYTISYKNNKAVTTADTKKLPTFTIKGKGNFKGTLTGTFRITTKVLSDITAPVTITANDIVYTGRAGKYISKPVLTDSNGKKLKAGTDYEKDIVYTLKDGTPLDKTSVVGIEEEVVVTVKGKGNYTGTLSTTYKVTELDFKKVKIKVTPKVYTGEAISLTKEDVEVTLGGVPLIFGEDYEIVEGSYKNNIRKGTASVTIKGKGSYGGSKTVKFKVVARELNK